MPAAQNDSAEVRQVEPFAHCQSTLGKASPKFGASRIPWLSGTATWSCYVATHWILGIRPEYSGLRIDPCIPAGWDGFEVRRIFRGHTLTIRVRNPRHVNAGVAEFTLNGQVHGGNFIPADQLADGAIIEAVLSGASPETAASVEAMLTGAT
jgi:cellobiose phosphorylase